MKRVILVGRPTHLAAKGNAGEWGRSACGAWSDDRAHDPRDVDCMNCRRTKRWKARMYGSGPIQKRR